MLGKLALRNVKKSSKDYIIYFVTIVLSFALIFAFNALVFSDDIRNLSKDMVNFQYAIIFVSVIALFVIGYLIYYTTKFMLEKRSKEFGIYLLLGIDNAKVANLFFVENFLLGLAALLCSYLVGTILYQMLLSIIVHIFELPFVLHISFSIEALFLTLFYFITILLFSLIKCRKKVRKMKICDLLYLDKKNENHFLKTSKRKGFLFILSLLMGTIGEILIYKIFVSDPDHFNMGLFLLGLALIIGCFYTFSMSVSSFVTEFLLKREKIKYHGENLFLLRNFSSKINTMGFTLGTLSLLFFFTFVGLHIGLLMKNLFDEQIKTRAPYDVSVYMPGKEDAFSKYTDLIESKYDIQDKIIYYNYTDHSHIFKDQLKEDSLGYQEVDGFIKISDYNKLLDMQGKKKMSLKEGEFLLHTFPKYASTLGRTKHIVIGDQKLNLKEIITTDFSSSWFPGCSYILIVPDDIIQNMEIINTVLSVNTEEKTDEAFEEEIVKLIEPAFFSSENGTTYEAYSLANVTVKGSVIAQQKSMVIMLGFSLFYVAFIFIATAATILSIQQLSDSAKYRFRYRILYELGVDEKEMNRLIFKQLVAYFAFPLFIPIILSILTTLSVHALFVPVIQNPAIIWFYIFISFLLFLLLYGLYFMLTYASFKKNVKV